MPQFKPHRNGRKVEFFSLTAALAEFRATVEREAGQPLSDLNFNAAVFLHDLVEFLDFDDVHRARILGANNYIQVYDLQRCRVSLTTKRR